MARYLIDTNVLVGLVKGDLGKDVQAILDDYENDILLSMESIKEMLVAYRTKNLLSNYWKSASHMVEDIKNNFQMRVMPVSMDVMGTLARLTINEKEKHYDPSDHVIIAHAMTLRIPLISSDLKFPFYRSQGLKLIESR